MSRRKVRNVRLPRRVGADEHMHMAELLLAEVLARYDEEVAREVSDEFLRLQVIVRAESGVIALRERVRELEDKNADLTRRLLMRHEQRMLTDDEILARLAFGLYNERAT